MQAVPPQTPCHNNNNNNNTRERETGREFKCNAVYKTFIIGRLHFVLMQSSR